MSGCWYPHAKFLIATQAMDWINDGYRAMLLMENSTALADLGAQSLADFGTLGMFDGTGYGDQNLANTDIIENVGEDISFVSDNVSFVGLGNGSERAKYILVYKNGALITQKIPVFLIGRGAGPSHPNGGTISAVIEAKW